MKNLSKLFNLRQLLGALPTFQPGLHDERRRKLLGEAIDGEDNETLGMVERTLALPAYQSQQSLKKAVLDGLRGKFTQAELTALSDSMNGVMWEDRHSLRPEYLNIQLDDFEGLENGISRHGALPEVLFEKVGQLDTAQRFFLINELLAFWHQPDAYGAPSPSLEKLWERFGA